MIKGILFDFDGTLINTNDLIFESYKVAFRKVLSRDIEMEEVLSLYGKPLLPSLQKYGDKANELYQTYREFNESNHDKMVKSFPGVYEGVKRLQNDGYKMGIVTSKRLHLVKRGLDILGLFDAFEVIITPDDTKKAKPHPEPVLLGCSSLGVLPDEALYVGDSIFDMEAGRRAGTKLCAVKYSVTPKEQLLSFAPEYFVSTIEELSMKMEG